MYSIEDYVKQTIMFTNSLVIKSTCSALAMNRWQTTNTIYPVNTADKTTWKYYMNLAGQKHITNSDVQCFVIELAEYRPLSKELLDKYTNTRKELLLNGPYYDDLVNNYPKDLLFIHGCLYPVDIQTAIKAKDGTLLAYNSNYVESNETSLIKEINDYTTNYFRRWFIKEYTLVDELYMATVLANLFAFLPNKIINIRLSKTITPEVHSFHLENFFRSNLNIWDELQILPKATIMWLYKNMPWIKKNIGKVSTFNRIVEKVFSENNIGIGSYIIRTLDVNLNLDKIKMTTQSDIPVSSPLYYYEDNILSTIKVNKYYEADNSKGVTVENMVTSQIDMLRTNKLLSTSERDKFIISNAITDINNSRKDNQYTKVLEIPTSKLFKGYGGDTHRIVLDHLLYFLANGKLNYSIEYVDPNTNIPYTLKPYDALWLALKYLCYLSGKPKLKISKLYFNYIMDPNPDLMDEIYTKFFQDGLTHTMIKTLKNIYPNIAMTINNLNDSREFIQSVIEFYTAVWFLDANSSSTVVSANIKHILDLITEDKEFVITDVEGGITPDDYLGNAGINIDITDNYDVIGAVDDLLTASGGIEVDSNADVVDATEKYAALLDKLTSYTVQVIPNTSEDEKMYLYYNNTDIYRVLNGVIQVLDGNLVPYDTTHIPLKGYANSFVDSMSVELLDMDAPEIAIGEWPIYGSMILINTTFNQWDPLLAIEVHDMPVLDVSLLDFKNVFITDAKGTITPYNQGSVRQKSYFTNVWDTPTERYAEVGNDTADRYTIEPYKPNEVSGYGVFLNNDYGYVDTTLIIEIEDPD